MRDVARQNIPAEGHTVILVLSITPVLARLALLLAKFGIRTIYFDPVGALRNPETMKRMAAAGVTQIDYAALTGFDAYARHKVLARWSAAAVETLFPAEVAASAAEVLPAVRNRPAKLQALVNDVVAQALRPYSTLGAVAEYLRGKGIRCVIWPLPSLWSAILFTRFAKLPTLVPAMLVATISSVQDLAAKLLRRLFSANTAAQVVGSAMAKAQTKPPVDAQVLMFPHQGLKYGNLFTKDQYYAVNSQGPLAKERICHVEIAGVTPDGLRESVLASYREAGLTPHILDMPPLSDGSGRWLKAIMSGWRRGTGLLASILLETVRGRVARGVAALGAFPNARLALLGYEFLFPPWLAYALQAKGVCVAATQERLMQCYLPGLTLVLDEYFVHGEAAAEKLAGSPFVCIDHVHPVGDVRAFELLRNSQCESFAPQGFKHVTLVLDWHSERDAVESAQHPTNCWANNKLFYRDMIALARQFHQSFFIVRGKNDDWLTIPEFEDVRRDMEQLPNISVSRDYSRPLVSYELAAMSDSVIARYTSLGDQCIAVGKPVIYHDGAANSGLLVKSVFDFGGRSIMVTNGVALNKLYGRLMEQGNLMPEDERVALARRYFNAPLPPGGAKAAVAARLEALVQ